MAAALDTFADDALVQSITTYVQAYMGKYDASHSWDHIERVVGLSRRIFAAADNQAALDLRVVQLAALLHDVGDRKYLAPGEDGTTMVAAVLEAHGAAPALAARVQAICLGVSYSSEVKDPARVTALVAEYPELAIVQDADRIDAIGAVGIGRVFTFSGARGAPAMADAMAHVDEKLLRLESMTKSGPGRAIARERTERLQTFKQWWLDEVAFSAGGSEK
ncbi:hypothetical protein B0T26DRAFT_640348 [Lasiosphaeria miniovina]|uniref:HD/PDEase domain-containing protein n=1 Tax=Lasiosphaeria miniovina TaxID=1954250 RepID=A0AA40E832_9PEZI|nr:uncharacterized protein B0T26DRAFT_640348 [Lasiosphaeria miniovina]KAK0728557.1 hypothetical protein B0T26DRAFT_640348 [Lasiosphaeria miniovina]